MNTKKGISAEWTWTSDDERALEVRKSRGKLTVDEIVEVLQYGRDSNGWDLQGRYAIFLNCTEETCGGNGLFDLDTTIKKGDVVQLLPMIEGGDCPLCKKMLPPAERCPCCGVRWKTEY